MDRRSAAAARILLLERRDTVRAPERSEVGIAPREARGARVRRYRLARVQAESRPVGGRSRFEHLKRTYD